jgi:hypothetical protein
LFEYFGKNVGIRRARGEFILVTNPDIIFSEELIAHLAQHELRADCFTKVDRYDVNKAIPTALPTDDLLRLCSRSVVNIWTGYRPVNPSWPARLAFYASLVRAFASRPSPAKLVRWVRVMFGRRYKARFKVPDANPETLHTGAGGDFLLMARRQWHELRGFPELPTNPQIDTYMVHLAWAAGLKQLVLPYRIYHQEHDRSAHAGRVLIELEDMPGFRQMVETRRPVITNGDEWGLCGIALPECRVSGSTEP